MEVPLEGGGVVVVEVDRREVPGELQLASDDPGTIAARARRALESSLADLAPMVRSIHQHLRGITPDEFTVEFGLNVGGETGLIIAKGTAAVNFTVSMTWRGESTT
ncbi:MULTISPECIES: CU044_2847 family protein [unclassified Frankia]|uniref:CU044_2847 family protein n=1 Tax=unclassified Frankia TaxID=2632575 RepID=UPI002AD277AD|nr:MULTISPECIES: CU044_2847 family protein [unclassified Frankia]